jgi:hypothetical protein
MAFQSPIDLVSSNARSTRIARSLPGQLADELDRALIKINAIGFA